MITVADSQPALELYCPTCEETFDHGELCPTDGTRLVRFGAQVDPLVGTSLDGRYTIVDKLGAGGMGAVYRAKQHSVGREVAIKVVNSNLTSDPIAVKRFLREAKLASRLAHPNVVGVLDFGQTREGVFYLVMELIDGKTLHTAIQQERFDANRIVRIATQVCDALEGAHRLPIIHRDLKPANIMLLGAGRDLIKVLDFGLAKSLAPEKTSTTMTSAGAVLGTPAFMPPEIANGDPHDERADLYSLGCIMYTMGTGRTPFITDSVPEMLAMHASEPAPPMTGVPQPLADVIDRLLAKRPEDRYRSAAELRAAIEAAHDASRGMTPLPDRDARMLGDAPTQSLAASYHPTTQGQTAVYVGPPSPVTLPPPPSVPARAQAPLPSAARTQSTRSHRRRWIAGAIGAVAIIAAIAIVASQRDSDPPARVDTPPAQKLTVEPIVETPKALEAPITTPPVTTAAPIAPPRVETPPPAKPPKRVKRTPIPAHVPDAPKPQPVPPPQGEPPPPF